MLVPISSYSAGPFVGLITNTILTSLSLLTLVFFPRYRVLKSLTLFCLSISLYFAGHAFYGLQLSDESILFWYRVMLLGLAWMPVSWIYFANTLRNRRSGAVTQAALGVSMAMSLVLILFEGPLVLGGTFEILARAGVSRPQSLILKPVILVYDLAVALASTFLIWKSWWPGPQRPSFVSPFSVGLIFWGLGGLHDAAYNLNLPVPLLGQPILWLASIWLSLCLTITVALHFRALDRDLIRRTEALIQARNLAAMGAAASKVAHEVGGFLNKVLFGAAVVRAEHVGPEAQKALETMENGAVSLDRFSRRFLDVARRPKVSRQPMSVAEAVNLAVEERWERLRAGNIGVILDIPGQIDIQGDWSLLVVAFGNLLDNSLAALKSSKSGGRIMVSSEDAPPGKLKIIFEDNGPGMSPGQVEKAFQPFVANRPAGTGLGLALIQSIIKAHEGTMNLLAKPGKGVRVDLILPRGLVDQSGAGGR